MEVKPNSVIGIVVAQQCSAPAVQTSLSAFHQVGSSQTQKVSLGAEYSEYLRLKTSIDNSTTYIYPKEGIDINDLMFELQNVHLKDLIESYKIVASKNFTKFKEHYQDLNGDILNKTCLQIALKKRELKYYKIDPYHIKYIIENNVHDVYVVISPIKECIIEILMIDKKPDDIHNLYYGLLENIKSNNTSLSNLQIKGIPNIWPLTIHKNGYIECRGCNIKATIEHENIDSRKTFTNNIKETYEYYGNIVTRKIIQKHLKTLFNSDIDDKSLAVLIGNMMYKGYPIPVSQDGTHIQGRSLLFKMTYERMMEYIKMIPQNGESPVASIYDKLAVAKINE